MRAPTPLPAESILEILAQGPLRIANATRGIADEILVQRPEPEEWSVVELLAHLRASADVRGNQRIERMLAEDDPTIRTMSPRSWPLISSYVALPFSESLAEFTEQRERLLGRLQSLNPDDWQRGATLTGLSSSRHETVFSEADILARHEESHIPQIEQRVALLRAGR